MFIASFKRHAAAAAALAVIAAGLSGCIGTSSSTSPVTAPAAATPRHAIVFVWDGLRPDLVNATDTPNLYALRQSGVNFSDNHATYPTFTMMNSASFATGSFPGTTGFYGNTLWVNNPSGTTPPSGNNAFGGTVDFTQPVFTEDYAILTDLNAYYSNQLLLVGTLFQAAQKAGLKTVALGKSGAAFLQDYTRGGIIVDERFVWPQTLAQELQAKGYALPKATPVAYPAGAVTLATSNGDPTAQGSVVTLSDGVTSDPTAQPAAGSPSATPLADPNANGAPPNNANAYMMQLYTQYILPQKQPDLTLIWFRNPDSTEHPYGPGTTMVRNALKSQDLLLGQLQAALKAQGWDQNTDIIIVSDHGHSNVAGDASLFPLRSVVADANVAGKNTWGAVDALNGYSVSGEVRTTDLMARAGFAHVYDGSGCVYDPLMSGLKADGTPVYATQTDTAGTVCGKAGQKYTTPAARVPTGALPADSIVIAANGGSEYLYMPSHDPALLQRAVSFLQSRTQYGAVFVNDNFYATLPAGTLSMKLIRTEMTSPATAARSPDVIVSFAFDDKALVQGLPGTEYESMFGLRGMHGSFSPVDVHNTLIANGPDFQQGYVDALPSGNVDVAPTVAQLLKLSLPQADGRALLEALAPAAGGVASTQYTLSPSTVAAAAKASGLAFASPTDPSGATADARYPLGSYGIALNVKDLSANGQVWRYFDSAKAVRQ